MTGRSYGQQVPTKTRPSYASLPTIVDDVLMWLLTPAEYLCLRYIIRHTYGRVDGQGGRKERDTIAQSQFESGIRSGPYLIDGGTGLSRPTIKTALRGLREKELLDTRHACTRCFWEQKAGAPEPAASASGGHVCPRCAHSLTTSYALAELRPSLLVSLLNRYDPQHRTWSWDDDKARCYFGGAEHADEKALAAQREAELEAEARELWARLWYAPLVKAAIDQAGTQRKDGANFPPSALIKHFIQPILDLQERYPAPLVEKALKITVLDKKKPAEQRRGTWNRDWARYALAICDNHAPSSMQRRGPAAGSAAHAAAHVQALARTVSGLLAQAVKLNGAGNSEAAHELLSEILSHAAALAPAYDGDVDKADYQLRLAFKQGSADLHVPRNTRGLDFYPTWDPDAAAGEKSAPATAAQPSCTA